MAKELAKESEKTLRERRKLKKKLDLFDQKVTVQALERKTVEIHRWIARHAPQRVVLKNKGISLFDENKNTADISQRVSKLALNLQKEIESK